MTSESGKTRSAVASPSSVCSRQTKPGLTSATALTGRQAGDEVRGGGMVDRVAETGDVDLGQVHAGARTATPAGRHRATSARPSGATNMSDSPTSSSRPA
jgi:hypothetical protein